MSLTKVTYSMIAGAPANITDFGAVNATSLQLAANYAVANNLGFVYIPAASITISSATNMQGIGIIGAQTNIVNTNNLFNVGPIISCKVRGFSTDDTIFDVAPATSGRSMKLLYREDTDQFSVFIKRTVKGYVKIKHWYNNFASGSSDTGIACENWRTTVVDAIQNVFVYKSTASGTTGTWTGPNAILVSQTFPGCVSAKTINYVQTVNQNDSISYSVNAKAIGQIGYACFYAAASGSVSVEISVNGVPQKTVSTVLVGTNYLVPVSYELTAIGANTVTITKKDATGSGATLRIVGVEFTELENLKAGQDVDTAAWGVYGAQYIPSANASDYAFYSIDQEKWFGSVHGGETQRATPVFWVDGTQTTLPASADDFVFGENIQIFQRTTIASGTDSLNIDSQYVYGADSTQELFCSAVGNAKVRNAYTAMTPASTDFNIIAYPKYGVTNNGNNLLGRHNKVVQLNRLNSLFPQSITTLFTVFPMGGKYGANMVANGVYVLGSPGVYNKLYYGPVTSSEVTLTDLGFSMTRMFE